MTTLITINDNGNKKSWEISEKILEHFEIFKDIEYDIKILGETIFLENTNQNDFSIVYKLLILEDSNLIAQELELYEMPTLYSVYKLIDFFHIKYLQERVGSIIAYRLNKMNVDDLKTTIQFF